MRIVPFKFGLDNEFLNNRCSRTVKIISVLSRSKFILNSSISKVEDALKKARFCKTTYIKSDLCKSRFAKHNIQRLHLKLNCRHKEMTKTVTVTFMVCMSILNVVIYRKK